MKYNFINDSYKIDFDIPDGLKKEIEYLEKLDRDNDYSFLTMQRILNIQEDIMLERELYQKNSGSNYVIDMEDFKNEYK